MQARMKISANPGWAESLPLREETSFHWLVQAFLFPNPHLVAAGPSSSQFAANRLRVVMHQRNLPTVAPGCQM
jgi:hypothetical protein